MENGCVFEPGYTSSKCQKYGIFCNGNAKSKSKCPEWGQTMVFEQYLKLKLELEMNEEDV